MDQFHGGEAKPGHNGDFLKYGLFFSFSIVAAIVAVVVVAVMLSRSNETTATVSHVGDHANMVTMGHLVLNEWDISGLGSALDSEVMAGKSVLELHNDGQTVHRFAIWHGGEVQGDQVVGGTLIAETGYIRAGEFTTLDVDLEPGEYVLICSVRGHAARGMYATVVLE